MLVAVFGGLDLIDFPIGTAPTTVDAFYSNGNNAIYVPAGVLQSPMFEPNFPDARKFGALGCILGHEMTHGFDDVGRTYDDMSRRRNWWNA